MNESCENSYSTISDGPQTSSEFIIKPSPHFNASYNESTLMNESCENSYSTTSNGPQTSSEFVIKSSSPHFHEDNRTTSTDTSHILSYEEILNLLDSSSSTIESTESQIEEHMDDQGNLSVRRLICFQSRISDFLKNKILK